MGLSSAVVAEILARYAGKAPLAETSYATVHDFCDSADHLPQVTGLNGDLKNVQRPWAVKTLLRCVPPPARLLEVGGGEPLVSDFLHQLGYQTTLIDPYDGSGHGPTEYELYCKAFPKVRIIRDYLRSGLRALQGESFDAIFSISVLEHLSAEVLGSCFEAIQEFLRPGGRSVHCFDFILQGTGDSYDRESASRIFQSQAALSQTPPPALSELITELLHQLETFYLSAQGHQLWRCRRAYAEFPFRKVVSLQTVATKSAA